MKQCLLALSISAAVLTSAAYAGEPLASENAQGSLASTPDKTLVQLIEAALSNDSARRQYYAEAQAMRETGKASATLMDPKLKFGVTGLPTDSFAFDEDPMTNITVGLMQQFNRGDTSDLNDRKASQQAGALEVKVAARELEVANAITQIWLELGYQQVANQVLLENRTLMSELENFIQTNYSIGKSEAQDLINAQLQVTKLDEKIQANEQMQQRLAAQLSEWLGSDWLLNKGSLKATNQLNWDSLRDIENAASSRNYYSLLNQNPTVQMLDASIDARRTQVDIARESYAPQFGVEVMYAYRQSNNMRGEPASDLVSAYITMDIPLFTGNKQDKDLAAAQYQVGAAQSQKDTLLSQMNAKVNALLIDKNNLAQRLERFESTLLPQADSRVKATERGYQNNTAQFNDVILATRDELALKLEYQRLITDLNLVNNNLSALLNSYSYQVDKPEISITSEQQ
uniref:TolC family protein n=1 Tax=Vibrio ziniensis TaxID=2711221 RepID=A0A6G7CR63_9VIBR|nr:TolC family protein [Vibrio ziniensis]